MKVWMMWYGGASYAVGTIDEDIEEFPSLIAAKDNFDGRADSWNGHYPMVERTTQDEGGQSAWIFFSDPRIEGNGDPYPDRILCYGPRGGLRVERT